MSIGEVAGYVAAVLTFATFYMKTMMPLRIFAIISNVAFITYALLEGLLPIGILHSALLPLNIKRLREFTKLVKGTREAARSDVSFELLLPFMTAFQARAGETLFNKGDNADRMFYVKKGRIRLPEIGKTSGPGDTIGETGLFTESRKRRISAVCETDCELLWMSEDNFLRLFYQDPRFGFQLVRVITKKLLQDYDRLVQAMNDDQQAGTAPRTAQVSDSVEKLDEKLPEHRVPLAPGQAFPPAPHRRRSMRPLHAAGVFAVFLVILAVAWAAGPYIGSLIIRDAVVTTWTNLATAPIDGAIRYAEVTPGGPVGPDGIIAVIRNEHLSRTAIDAAVIRVERARRRPRVAGVSGRTPGARPGLGRYQGAVRRPVPQPARHRYRQSQRRDRHRAVAAWGSEEDCGAGTPACRAQLRRDRQGGRG